MPRIVLTNQIAVDPAECFSLSLSVEAHTASMSDSGERATAGVTSGVMGMGDTVTWRARHFGLPFTMTSRITEHEPPHRFVDEQLSGPFGSWRHEHCFEPVAEGTLMTDLVDFEAPFGIVGRLANRLFVTSYLTRLLEQRNRWLAEELQT